MALPPVDDGEDHVRLTWLLPRVPATPVGVPGVVNGVIAFVTSDHAPVPAAFTAATLNVYPVPLVRPVTVVDRAVDTPSANVDQLVPRSEENCTV